MAFTFEPKKFQEERTDFAPLPVGEYAVKIIESGEKLSAGGNEMIALTLEVQDKAHVGRKIWDHIVNNEYANKKIGQILESCGVKTDEKMAISAKLFHGKIGTVVVKHEEYNGKTSGKVNYWKQASSVVAPTGDTAEIANDGVPF